MSWGGGMGKRFGRRGVGGCRNEENWEREERGGHRIHPIIQSENGGNKSGFWAGSSLSVSRGERVCWISGICISLSLTRCLLIHLGRDSLDARCVSRGLPGRCDNRRWQWWFLRIVSPTTSPPVMGGLLINADATLTDFRRRRPQKNKKGMSVQ